MFLQYHTNVSATDGQWHSSNKLLQYIYLCISDPYVQIILLVSLFATKD